MAPHSFLYVNGSPDENYAAGNFFCVYNNKKRGRLYHGHYAFKELAVDLNGCDVSEAMSRAKQARFEHGESP